MLTVDAVNKRLQELEVMYYKAIVLVVQKQDVPYGRYPYIYHVMQVKDLAEEVLNKPIPYVSMLDKQYHQFIIDRAVLRVAAILHDTIEDGGLSRRQLADLFDAEVAEVVFSVTNEKGINRLDKLEKTAPKMQGDVRSTFLKLCDRIRNYEQSIKRYDDPNNAEPKLLKMYDKEADRFRELLYAEHYSYSPVLAEYIPQMWEKLDWLVKEGRRLLEKS